MITTATAAVIRTLATQTYADAQNALRSHRTAVDAADTAFVPLTQLGAPSGVATLDVNGDLTAAQVPLSLLTDQTIACYAASGAGLILSSGTWHTVTTTTVREFTLATLVIPDPGFPWRPFPFAWVAGNSAGAGIPASRQGGTGSFGLLTVMPPSGVSDIIYGTGICAGSYYTDTYLVPPVPRRPKCPPTPRPSTGGLTLTLSGCCFGGSSYTYFGQNLVFFCIAVPAL